MSLELDGKHARHVHGSSHRILRSIEERRNIMSYKPIFRSLGLGAASLLIAGAGRSIAAADTLTVLDHNDTWARGNGDEVAIGRILFHATFGDPASTAVTVDDRLHELGSDLSEEETITLPEDLVPVGQLDFGGVPIVDWEDDVEAHDAPVAVSGSIAIALELDLKGTGKARSRINNAANELYDALDFFIAGPNGSLSGHSGSDKLVKVAVGFYCVQAVLADVMLPSLCRAHPDHPEWSDAGEGLSFGESLGRWFKSWFSNVGHDPIGAGGVLSLNVTPADLDAKLGLIRLAAPSYDIPPEAIPSCGDSPTEPALVLCAPYNRPVSIHFKGEDAHWRIDTHVIPPSY
jgi:hypothetical protein